MCRDRGYVASKEDHISRWNVDVEDYHAKNFNLIAGGPGLPIIMHDSVEERNTSQDAVWGIIPFKAKSRKEGMILANKMVNARVETVRTNNLYKWLLEKGQRCLIPCSHYFEHHWIDGGKIKVPFAVKKNDDPVFSTPGLYSTWTDRDTGEVILNYTMLTTAANALLKKVHNGGTNPGRMPLVIEKDMEALWLNPNATEREVKEVMNYKIPANRLEAWPVHTIMGKNARTGPDVLEPWKEYERILS